MRPSLKGIPFDPVTEDGAIARIVDGLGSGTGGRVVTPNVDILRQATVDAALGALVGSADLVLADGMPIVWALRLQGSPVPQRVAGSSLAPRLAAAAADGGVGLFLLGGSKPDTAASAARSLAARFPQLRVGSHFPPFGFERDESERRAIEDALTVFGPCLCLCGLGFPKQDLVAADLLRRFPDYWFLGAGATIDFLAGEFRRAPVWMQRSGLEWVYRLSLEPRRLFGRYIVNDAPFASRLLAGSLVTRWTNRRPAGP